LITIKIINEHCNLTLHQSPLQTRSLRLPWSSFSHTSQLFRHRHSPWPTVVAASELAPPPANVCRRSNVVEKITVFVPVLWRQSLRAAGACSARYSPLAPSASSLLTCYSAYRVGSDRTRQRDRVQRLSLTTSRRKLCRHD